MRKKRLVWALIFCKSFSYFLWTISKKNTRFGCIFFIDEFESFVWIDLREKNSFAKYKNFAIVVWKFYEGAIGLRALGVGDHWNRKYLLIFFELLRLPGPHNHILYCT